METTQETQLSVAKTPSYSFLEIQKDLRARQRELNCGKERLVLDEAVASVVANDLLSEAIGYVRSAEKSEDTFKKALGYALVKNILLFLKEYDPKPISGLESAIDCVSKRLNNLVLQ